MQVTSNYLPFGGVGSSGYGRYHGYEGFKMFSNMKSCLVRPTLDFAPFNTQFPPYNEDQKKQILSILPYSGTTQAAFCKKISWCCIIMLLAIVAIVIWNPIATSVAELQTKGLARSLPIVASEDLMKQKGHGTCVSAA